MVACPEDYQSYGSFCYKFYDASVTWEQASTACNAEKSSLVSIKNKAEYEFVESLVAGDKEQATWIGLNNRSVPNVVFDLLQIDIYFLDF